MHDWYHSVLSVFSPDVRSVVPMVDGNDSSIPSIAAPGETKASEDLLTESKRRKLKKKGGGEISISGKKKRKIAIVGQEICVYV